MEKGLKAKQITIVLKLIRSKIQAKNYNDAILLINKIIKQLEQNQEVKLMAY